MNYFEFVSRGTSWELVNVPLGQGSGGLVPVEGVARAEAVREGVATPPGALNYEVTERQLTDEEIELWTRKVNEQCKPSSSLAALPWSR